MPAVWKVRALFLVPVLSAVAVAAWVSWTRPAEPDWPVRPSGPRGSVNPRVESFTPAGYARYLAAYQAPAEVGRWAFLVSAHQAGEHVAAYRAVEDAHAAEAFRELSCSAYREMVVHAERAAVPGAADTLRDLIAAHEARCGPDPDPLTVLFKAFLLVRAGRFAEAEPLAARAAAAFPVPPSPVPGGGQAPPGVAGVMVAMPGGVATTPDGRWEFDLARECALGVYVELGRWKGPGPFRLPPGATVVEVFWRLDHADRLGDAADLLDRSAAATPPDRATTRCRALLEYRRGRWAECLAAAEAYRARSEPDILYEEAVGACRAKALARVGRFAEADRALAELRPSGRAAAGPAPDEPLRAEFVVALVAGDAARADRLLADGRLVRAGVLEDDEVRPLWQAGPFAALRAKYPAPDRPGR